MKKSNKQLVCGLAEAKKKKDPGLMTRLVQRINPMAVKAAVRYDVLAGSLAVLDASNKPKQHFDTAVMENVEFRSCKTEEYVGCAGTKTVWIGIADGELYLHRHAGELEGAQNLHYNDGKFMDSNNAELRKVSKLAILPGRRAIYWP